MSGGGLKEDYGLFRIYFSADGIEEVLTAHCCAVPVESQSVHIIMFFPQHPNESPLTQSGGIHELIVSLFFQKNMRGYLT